MLLWLIYYLFRPDEAVFFRTFNINYYLFKQDQAKSFHAANIFLLLIFYPTEYVGKEFLSDIICIIGACFLNLFIHKCFW
jgi:hypothetical protein